MSDMLNLDKTEFATMMPAQLLVAAIIRRTMADLPISRRFFESEIRMFHLCCEVLSIDPYNVRAQIAISLNTNAKRMWRAISTG
jgi:hypothetical protein